MEFIPPKRAKLNLFEKIITILLMFFLNQSYFGFALHLQQTLASPRSVVAQSSQSIFFSPLLNFEKTKVFRRENWFGPRLKLKFSKGTEFFRNIIVNLSERILTKD